MDFEKLKQDIEAASQTCFAQLRKKYADEDICGYSLYSDAGAVTVSPALNSRQHLHEMCKEDPEDAIYYKWSPGEWAHEFEGSELFSDISTSLREHAKSLTSEEQFSAFRNGVYEACVAALSALANKGFFDNDRQGNVIVFTLSDAEDPDSEIKWIARLNDEKLAKEFADWIRST